MKKQRNTELVMICTNIIHKKKIDVIINDEKSAIIHSDLSKKNIIDKNDASVSTAPEEKCNNISTIEKSSANDNNGIGHKTVVWLKYENQIVLDDLNVSASFVDEALWGCDIIKSQIIQNINPSEWARERSRESGESECEIRDRGSLEGEDGKKRRRRRGQGWPSSLNDNDDDDNDDFDDFDGRAIKMYDSIQNFFVKLQILLLQGRKNNSTIPFDCTLLVDRIKHIILLIVMS